MEFHKVSETNLLDIPKKCWELYTPHQNTVSILGDKPMNIFGQVLISDKNVRYLKDVSQRLSSITLIPLKDDKIPLGFIFASYLSLRVNYSKKNLSLINSKHNYIINIQSLKINDQNVALVNGFTS